ncbi:alpha,alpha-trehalose-phosphate synthase (UDP-forming) [Marinitenerispora sediminis]|uniref:Trehalose-6-phosphate synthase n=1 Tax=Marinitenerispora sediminis TaxID=1931232 RepID=A0A368T7D8_9ACTN|nr:trehalose-6-phosphate synthase [Marinitenerispora sediminis]RCV54897.1 trehalose-6-phosphate synthase [Marinitenerispora sediminis]RCV57413.1 trehalose-6-phosphate synthase [Marinitenerispora sediminis]RCV60292.1 trehalose-6-phosphate synthase [Marinitenerispora sediminis]
MDKAQILVASNRGPVSFSVDDDGSLGFRRGGGGLVSGLSAVAAETDTLWVCAALSDADRKAASSAPGGRLDKAGFDLGGALVRMLDIPPRTFANAYTSVANSTLWFVHHMLYDTPNKPHFDADFRGRWDDYREYNAAFAEALVTGAAENARVAVQDYHLALLPRMIRGRRPDLRITHFSHTPWAPPEYFRMLPAGIARELLEGMLGADHVGFLSQRWADAFLRCCETFLRAEVNWGTRTVDFGGRLVRVGVHALGADGEGLRARAAADDVAARRAALRELVGDRKLILRVDRTELSKNIVRGLAAYRELLVRHPEWRGRVTHLAFAYPSRGDVPEYREYTESVQRTAKEINEEFGTADWTPLILEVNDDYPRSLASYQLADVLLVNPIRDGMNLVAKEGPTLSQEGCALVLSTEAGAADDLRDDALMVNPYDVTETAEALHEALLLPAEERRARCERLAERAVALPPQRWFAEQLRALG